MSSSWKPPFYSLSLSQTTPGASYKWNHTIVVLSWLSSFPQHNVKIHPCGSVGRNSLLFLTQMISHCMERPHLIYPFICWWTWVTSAFWLLWIMLPPWVYKYWIPAFTSFLYIPRSGIVGFYGNFYVGFFFKEPPCHFPQQLHHFTFPAATHRGSNFSTSLWFGFAFPQWLVMFGPLFIFALIFQQRIWKTS